MDYHLQIGQRYMEVKPYSSLVLANAHKFMSSDALNIIVCNVLARRLPLSVVRMGDGERLLIRVALELDQPKQFLLDDQWLIRYGLKGADLKTVGIALLQAAMQTDYFGPNIYGLVSSNYNLLDITSVRDRYVEGLFGYTWYYMGRVHNIIRYGGPVAVVCRSANKVMQRLVKIYGLSIEHGYQFEFSSWQDYDKVLDQLGHFPGQLVLCAVGPSGKYLVVEAAKRTGKVVLDIGSALINKWSVEQ